MLDSFLSQPVTTLSWLQLQEVQNPPPWPLSGQAHLCLSRVFCCCAWSSPPRELHWVAAATLRKCTSEHCPLLQQLPLHPGAEAVSLLRTPKRAPCLPRPMKPLQDTHSRFSFPILISLASVFVQIHKARESSFPASQVTSTSTVPGTHLINVCWIEKTSQCVCKQIPEIVC